MKKVGILIALLVSSCATPPESDKKAKEYLVGSCYEMFTASGLNSYQHYARVGQVAFALATDGPNGAQVCGKASDRWNDLPNGFIFSNTPMAQLEAMAIQRCEAMRAQTGNIKSPCKTFARNNDIIWGEALSRGMK